MKINKRLLPIKAHFFFFFAGLGPVLPQLNMFGRQLGVSPAAMGIVTAVLPLLWALAKPALGAIVDYMPNHRKLMFMLLILIMTGSYCCLWFIPMPKSSIHTPEHIYRLNNTVYLKNIRPNHTDLTLQKYSCHWSCHSEFIFDVYFSNTRYINTLNLETDVLDLSTPNSNTCDILFMDFDYTDGTDIKCVPRNNCHLMCFDDFIRKNNLNYTESIKTESKITDIYNSTKDDIGNFTVETENTKEITADILTNHIGNNNSLESNSIRNKINDIDKSQITKNDTDIIDINKNNTNFYSINGNNKFNTNNDYNTEKRINISVNENGTKSSTVNVIDEIEVLTQNNSDPVIERDTFYTGGIFWSFVILMSVGTVAFNVANSVGDAVCFDVLGPESASKYGVQRMWGTFGYGVTALLGGWLTDLYSESDEYKNFTPAFLLAAGVTGVDLYFCQRLQLPSLSTPSDLGALRYVLSTPRMLLFICFAIIAGVFDSFFIYYMFWFLEELAESTGEMAQIKLIEGIIIAGQCFVGEMLFFFLSGKIINKLGYGNTLTLALFCYSVRLVLISLISRPWHMIVIESIMQGPTYALCYSTIVGYAAEAAPPGYSATVQGLVGGADDGLGFAVGSLVGGQLYLWTGGRLSFRVLGGVALVAAVVHAGLVPTVLRADNTKAPKPVEEGEKMLSQEQDGNRVYNDTVMPLTSVKETDR